MSLSQNNSSFIFRAFSVRKLLSFSCAAVLLLPLCACNPMVPTITQKEKDEMAERARPQENSVNFGDTLTRLGAVISTKADHKMIIQPKAIGNVSGAYDLPLNVTDMVISGLSKVSSSKLLVVPYDPEYIMNDTSTGGASSRQLPNLVIAGNITEFDRDVDSEESAVNANAVVDHGDANTSLGLKTDKSRKISRVSLDLYLIDYKTQTVIPGASVSNTVNITEIEKNREFSFSIFGSGLDLNGSISHNQGFHRAVRNLVDYSLIQLLSRYYKIPYEPLLGLQTANPQARP